MIRLFLRFSLFWNSSKVLMIVSCVISLFIPFAKLTDDDCRDICIGGGLDSVGLAFLCIILGRVIAGISVVTVPGYIGGGLDSVGLAFLCMILGRVIAGISVVTVPGYVFFSV